MAGCVAGGGRRTPHCHAASSSGNFSTEISPGLKFSGASPYSEPSTIRILTGGWANKIRILVAKSAVD